MNKDISTRLSIMDNLLKVALDMNLYAKKKFGKIIVTKFTKESQYNGSYEFSPAKNYTHLFWVIYQYRISICPNEHGEGGLIIGRINQQILKKTFRYDNDVAFTVVAMACMLIEEREKN